MKSKDSPKNNIKEGLIQIVFDKIDLKVIDNICDNKYFKDYIKNDINTFGFKVFPFDENLKSEYKKIGNRFENNGKVIHIQEDFLLVSYVNETYKNWEEITNLLNEVLSLFENNIKSINRLSTRFINKFEFQIADKKLILEDFKKNPFNLYRINDLENENIEEFKQTTKININKNIISNINFEFKNQKVNKYIIFDIDVLTKYIIKFSKLKNSLDEIRSVKNQIFFDYVKIK